MLNSPWRRRAKTNLQTIEEIPESISPFSDEGRLDSAIGGASPGEGSGQELEADRVSELSYTSARSSPANPEDPVTAPVVVEEYQFVRETRV